MDNIYLVLEQTLHNLSVATNSTCDIIKEILPKYEKFYDKLKYKIITLCGSTKFKDEFKEQEKRLTMEGNIVLTCGLFAHADNIKLTEKEKIMLDDMHKRKIDMSDSIFIINVNGYIGESTKNEIEYAKSLGKPIEYLEKP